MVMVVMSALTPSMGASFVVLLFSSNALDSDGLGMAWIEWFVPNVSHPSFELPTVLVRINRVLIARRSTSVEKCQ